MNWEGEQEVTGGSEILDRAAKDSIAEKMACN